MTLFFFYQYNDTQLSCVFEKKKRKKTLSGCIDSIKQPLSKSYTKKKGQRVQLLQNSMA
jgi:hypothetical protein